MVSSCGIYIRRMMRMDQLREELARLEEEDREDRKG